MITKYKLVSGGAVECRITKVEVVRETSSFVVFENGRKDAKSSTGQWYFDTFEQAREYMFTELARECDAAHHRLVKLREELSVMFNLEEKL